MAASSYLYGYVGLKNNDISNSQVSLRHNQL